MIYIATNNFNDGFPLSNAYDDAIYQKANNEYYLKFRYPVDRFGVWKNLTCETVLKADDARGVQLFRIKKINKINGYIRVYAKHITDDINFIEVNQLNVTNATGKRVMTALAGSIVGDSKFVFDSDIATMHTLNLSDTTAGDILSKDKRSIIGQWGGELVRNNFLINLKARGGVDTEILFMNKKNVKNQDNSISTENLITRLKLSVEVEKENNEKEVIKATVESPYINTYPRVYTGYLKVTDKNVTDREKLIEYGNRYFRNTLIDFPKDNLTVNVIDKNQERINLFDTVWFRNVEYGIDKRLKVVAYEYSPMSKRYIKISFGALKINSLSQVKNLNQLEERIDEKIEESRVDAFKIQKNLAELLKKDRTAIEEKMKNLEEQSKAGVEVKKALFEKNGTVPEVTRTKILDAIEADIARLKTIITEAEMVKAIQARLNYAEIKTALIDKAFVDDIISNKTFKQQFEAGEVTTQNIFTKMLDSIQSSIKKEFITKEETKKLVNDLTIGADGIRQITQEETNKIFEIKKNELKGKDGKVPTFNQLIGTRFPSLDVVKPVENTQLKLNKKDYNGQNSIEVLPNASNELQGFSVKVNLKGNAPSKQVIRIPIYVFSDSGNNAMISLGIAINGEYSLLFSIPLLEVPKGENKWIIVEKQTPFNNNNNQDTGFFDLNNFAFISTGNAHFKIAEPYIAISDVVTDKWLPAIEDMQSYSLTASARIEGSYLNENLANCKVYLDVYNNGEIVRTSTTETPLKIEIKKLVASGYTASGEVTLDSNGLVQNINIPNGTKNGQPIEVVFEVTCGTNKTTASARLNNTIDKQLLTETISKVKTFESTIDKFESKIGEINKQKFKMAYNIENICSESGVEKKGNDLYFNAKTPLKKDKEYYVLADLEDVPENQNTRLYNAKDNGDSKIISNSLNVWRVSYASDQTRVNIYPLGTNTKVKNVEIYEVPEFENPKENLIKITNENFYNQGNIVIVAQETLVKNDVYTLEFEVGNSVNGSMSTTFFNGVTNLTVKKPLVKGLNKLTIRGAGISNTILVSIPTNLSISNVKFYKEKFNTGYKNEYNITEMESKINQTKEQIEQSVKKNEFGTVLTQNAQYLKLAWNNISKYIQFENAGMSFYEGGQVNDNKLVARLNDSGYQMWRDGYYLGSIGTNSYKQDRSKKGIQFDLNYDGWFMGWAYQTSRNADAYTWKWVYSSGNFATYKADTLNAGCDIDMQNNEIKNVILKSTNITVWDGENGTFRFSLPVSFQSDGRAYQWHDNCYLTFKNGLLIDSSMPR
jgi:phage minor structural protein